MTIICLLTALILATLIGDLNSLVHEILVLSENVTGRALFFKVDGMTIQTPEYYTDKYFKIVTILSPKENSARLMVKFEYMDLPMPDGGRCEDSLSICQLGHTGTMCTMPMVDRFCGDLERLFPPEEESPHRKQHHSMTTMHPGRGIRIQWSTGGRRTHKHRGFKLVVTAFTATGFCNLETKWKCSDGRCVSRDLHCDGVSHCLDRTDETRNCTLLGPELEDPPYSMECTREAPCYVAWSDHWFGLILPMAGVFVLLIIGIIYKAKRMFSSEGSPYNTAPFHRRVCRQQSSSQSRAPEPSAPPDTAVDMFDPSQVPMILPPPYESTQLIGSHRGPCIMQVNGEPPPIYEEAPSSEHQSLTKSESNEDC